MTPREIYAHKLAIKQLSAMPEFKLQKRGKLPRPLAKIGGPRIFCTGMLNLSDDHLAVMYWRDGDLLTDRLFMGHLFCKLSNGSLSPIFEFHWHPSHKGFHCKTPCKTEINYTDRLLPGAPEMALKTQPNTDPKKISDLIKLVYTFCNICGISMSKPASDDIPKTMDLWPL